MEISRYLAMTQEEMAAFSPPAGYLPGFMACHFSPYGTGLSNIPRDLPAGSMLILSDRVPIRGHDPVLIRQQLEDAVLALECGCVLLDFQQPEIPETKALCEVLTQALPCPIGVSELYAQGLICPVFLSPALLDQSLREHIAPWEGREIWLDIAPEAACITVTEGGSTIVAVSFSEPPENSFEDSALHIRYRAEIFDNKILFHLWRDLPQLEALLEEAKALGITKAIGLYQQLHCAN